MQSHVGVNKDALLAVSTMLRMVRLVDQRFRQTLATDLSLADLSVLTEIASGTDSPSAVATALHIDRPRVTRITDRLASLGYVEREVGSEDRRRWRLSVTRSGSEWRRHAKEVLSETVDHLLAHIDEADRAALLRSLTALSPVLDDSTPDVQPIHQ